MDETVNLVRRVLSGDTDAWRELQAMVDPTILRIARRHHSLRRKGLAEKPDDLAEIRTATLESLASAEFSNLRRFIERYQATDSAGVPPSAAAKNPQSFDGWLYGLVDFVIREHLRKRFGRASVAAKVSETGMRTPSKRELQSHAGRLDASPEPRIAEAFGVTTRLTLAEILAYIDREFSVDEARAARMYFFEDRGFDEIAAALQLEDARGAERLVRRLNARLRYRFGSADSSNLNDNQ